MICTVFVTKEGHPRDACFRCGLPQASHGPVIKRKTHPSRYVCPECSNPILIEDEDLVVVPMTKACCLRYLYSGNRG